MKQRSEQDIVFFISAILGIFGTGILLIPDRFHSSIINPDKWVMALGGLAIFSLSLGMASSIFISYPAKPRRGIRAVSVLVLWIMAAVCALDNYIIIFIILFFSALIMLSMETPLKKYILLAGSTNILGVSIGLSAFLFLYISNNNFPESILAESYRRALMSALFITALLGMLYPFLRHPIVRRVVKRLHAIPWIMWFVIVLPDWSVTEAALPIFLAATLAGTGLIPWERMEISENDVLGRRVLMIGNTLLLTLIIFLGALLTVTDIHSEVSSPFSARDGTMLFFVIISGVIYYEIATILMTLNGLIHEMDTEAEEDENESHYLVTWNERLARYLKPYIQKRKKYISQIQMQAGQVKELTSKIEAEKKRSSQLNLLLELNQQLEDQMDHPVSAQMAVNTLERVLNVPLVRLYLHEHNTSEFMLLASAGEQKSMLKAGYRQSSATGALGRTVRLRKTQVIQNINEDPEYIRFDREKNISCILVPMIFNGHIKGMLVINSENENAFGGMEVAAAESVAESLIRAWERSNYHERLTNLIQAGSQLSSALDPATTASELTAIAREVLDARFIYIQLKLGEEGSFYQSASSGNAPLLLASLGNETISGSLIQTIFKAEAPFRVRDIRKYSITSNINIDSPNLRSMITVPIRWHRVTIGALLAFGKNNEVFFTESDESIVELLALQAAGSFESTWLQQELRASLRTISLLYRLSTYIIQAESLQDAAQNIATTAHKLSKGMRTGIVLFSVSGEEEASIIIDPLNNQNDEGVKKHPMETINQVMESGQLIYMSLGQSTTHICVPIQTTMHKYGALWTNMPESRGQSTANPADLQTLANQAAIALERSMLLVESRRQAEEIKSAYYKLESTYDQTLAALISALDARDEETEGHSLRVSGLAAKLGEALGFTYDELKLLERGSLLHDIGKIGISDTILHKPGPLTEDEWRIMKMHPDIGARIVDKIPFLEDTIPLIRHHQERWNGTGYPEGLKEKEIPLLARMFSIVDAFDALTSKRPYRQSILPEEAIRYLEEQSGILFDPEIVTVFKRLVLEDIEQGHGEAANEIH